MPHGGPLSPKLVTRGLLAAVMLAVCVVFSTLGAHAYPAAGGPATARLDYDRAPEPHQIRLHAGQAEAFRLRIRTFGITDVAYIHIHIDIGSESTARAVAVGIYSDAGDHPGSLLSRGTTSSLRVHAWSTVPVTPTQLASGGTYWLAVLGEGGTLRYRSPRHGPCLSNLSVQTHLHELPPRWSTGRVRARTRCPVVVSVATAGLAPSLSPSASGLTVAPLQPSAPAAPTPSPGEPSPSKEPPPPPAPKNTAPAIVSGSAVENQTLTASRGTWSGSPTSYAYQWDDCNKAGESCSPISGATASRHVLASSDVGHTLRVVVKATNAGGTGEAISAATGVVTVEEKIKEGTPTNCFAKPEGCGYPGPDNTGPGGEGTTKCAGYPEEGAKIITAEGEIKEKRFTEVTIKANNVTLNDVCVTGHSETLVNVYEGEKITVENSVIRGEGLAEDESTEESIRNSTGQTNDRAIGDYFYNCLTCIFGSWTVEKTFAIDNATPSEYHIEPLYNGLEGTDVVNDDTFFNPHKGTAAYLTESNAECKATNTITNSFLAGGDITIYACAGATSGGGNTLIKDNRFARCTTEPFSYFSESGGHACSGGTESEPEKGSDSHGYFPYGGLYGVVDAGLSGGEPSEVGITWEGNYWDDNLEKVEP
jgi:hypothetical protein